MAKHVEANYLGFFQVANEVQVGRKRYVLKGLAAPENNMVDEKIFLKCWERGRKEFFYKFTHSLLILNQVTHHPVLILD